MRKNIYLRLSCLIAIILLVSCSAAPPTDPTTGFEPHSAPKKPASVTATNGYSDTIEITWDEVDGATGYQIWAVPASQYGARAENTNRTESYATLIQRGFRLIDVVTSETSYRLKGESTNSSYVFSVIAMKVERGTSSTSALYSEPSDYVEGGTVGEIILSATASSDNLTLSWNISNLYSVLDNSNSPEALYPHRISILKKLSSSSEWEEVELPLTEDEEHTYSIPSSSLNIDTLYDFKIRMKVYSGDTPINTVESDIYTITTDDAFTPGRVENILSTSGKKKGEVTLSWTVPELPEKDGIETAFRVERTTDGSVWTTLTAGVTETDGVYSVTDDTLDDNTLYTYRIINGYRIGERAPVYQSEKDAETVSSVYSLWLPGNIAFTFIENDDHLGGTLKVSYDYKAPSASGEAKFYIGGRTWTENDFTHATDLEEKEGSTYTVSLTAATPLSYYSFYFRFTFDGEEILRTPNPDDVTVGLTSSHSDLITGIKATDDRVNEIKLSWTENSSTLSSLGITGDPVYSIYEGDKEQGYTPEKEGDTRYVIIPAESGVNHTYRVKISAGGYFGVLEASGNALAAPEGLDAGDSTSAEEIRITWTPSAKSSVVYTLEYSSDKENWSELSYTIPGEATLPAAKDGTDGREYYFRLKAVNTEQEGTPSLYSNIETGSVFGAYGISPVVVNSGLDPDCITIKWNAVKGARYYIVSRNGTEIAQKIRNSTEYSDSADTIAALKTSSTPLSEEYTYTVTPYLDDNTPAVITDLTNATAGGKLFAPPKNVRASKGVEADRITVTWDSADNADRYKIEKYSVTMKNGVSSYPSLMGTSYTTDTSYTEENASLASSYFVQYVISSVRDEGDEKIVSRKQTGSEKVKNSLGFDEESNIGYGLMSVKSLTVSSKVNESTGFYEPYTVVTWSYVPGATSYTLTSSVGEVVIPVSDLKYDSTGTTDNGKRRDESGYLSFDGINGVYTYNDNSGLLTTTVINKYSITAYNGTAANGAKENATAVYRQPTEEDWVSILMNILSPAFKAADSSFKGDWWITNAVAWKSPSSTFNYGSTGMTFSLYTNSISKNYPYAKNYLSISEYTDETNNIKLSTTANIQFDVTDEEELGNLGTDPLKLIGYDGNGQISITPLDSKIKSATVAFRNIYVKSVDTGGSYTVTISGSGSKTITDDAKFTRVL